ncbi:hypothetical protein I4U23_022626 [Adineta vaga]|nr:hypothetical protein I4U23_022626 [Adineta vaga]
MIFGQSITPCCPPPPPPCCPPPSPPICVPVCRCVEQLCCDPCLGQRRITQCFQTMVRIQ